MAHLDDVPTRILAQRLRGRVENIESQLGEYGENRFERVVNLSAVPGSNSFTIPSRTYGMITAVKVTPVVVNLIDTFEITLKENNNGLLLFYNQSWVAGPNGMVIWNTLCSPSGGGAPFSDKDGSVQFEVDLIDTSAAPRDFTVQVFIFQPSRIVD